MILRRTAFFACIMILASSAGFCENATMGRYGPEQMSFTTEKLEPPLILNWEFASIKNHGNAASPISADGVCYFSSGDRLYALDMVTGNTIWKYPMDGSLTSAIKATPAIVDGQIYFGTGDGKLYCLNAKNGTFQWFFETRGSIRCPPVSQDGILYFGADDNSIYTLDAATGDTLWTKPFVGRDDFGNGIAVGAGMVVGSCMDGNLYGISSSGKLRWGFRLPNAPIKTSPIMSENTTIMAVGNVMYGISTRSGQKKWYVQLASEAAATPATDGTDIIVPCRNKKIYCYNIAGRQPVLKWTEPADAGGIPLSSPTIADKIVYVTASHGVVTAFSVADGTLKWRYVLGPSSITAPGQTTTDASSSPVVANGALLVLTDDGVLHCFTKTAPDSSIPEITNIVPINGTRMSGVPPIKLSATLWDLGSGVDLGDGRDFSSGSATMLLDGEPVELTVDLATGTISHYTDAGDPKKSVAKPLKDGIHLVTLIVKDYLGNQLTKEWNFTADSTMPVPKRAVVQPGKRTRDPGNKKVPNAIPNPGAYPSYGGGSGEMAPPPPPPMGNPGGNGGYNTPNGPNMPGGRNDGPYNRRHGRNSPPSSSDYIN